MRLCGLLVFPVCLLSVMGAIAQSCDIPVDIVGLEKGKDSGGIIRGLKAEDVVAIVGKGKHAPIESLTYDATPRRILFVLDTTRELPSDARRAEAQTALSILDRARPMDSFALITARGSAREVKFDQGRTALKDALQDLSNDPRDKPSSLGVLDAVEQGIEWMGTPKPGDAIFLMAMDLEGNHKTNPRKTAQVLHEHHIRLFSIALGFVNLANSVKATQAMTHLGLGLAEPLVGGVLYDNGEQNLYPMVVNSGGFLSVQNANDGRREFKLSERLPRMQQIGMQFYQIIAEFYHLKVSLPDAHTREWTVELSDSAKQRWTPIWSVYPQEVYGCK